MSNKKITLAKIMPCQCLEQTKICKNLVVETVSFDMEVDQRIAELTADGYEIIK